MAGGDVGSEFGDGKRKTERNALSASASVPYRRRTETGERARGFGRGGSKARVTPTRPNPTRTRGSSVEPRTEASTSAPTETTKKYYGIEIASSSAGRPAESTLVVLYALSSIFA